MEKALLIAILVVAVAILARAIWRTLSSSAAQTKSPACAGCPFDSKCGMQDRPHINQCGDSTSDDG